MQAIVLILRGCSAGWLGAYGNEWIATPNLDRIAAEGAVFDRHFSDCPDPVAAGRAWLGGSPRADDSPTPPLLDFLRAAGVPTALVRANHPDNDAPDWYYAGWGELFDVRPQEEDRFSLDSLVRALPGILDRLATSSRFLLWIEIDSLLPPWDIREDVFRAYVEDSEEEEWPNAAVDENEEEEVEGDEADDDEADEFGMEVLEEIGEESASGPTPEETEPATPWTDPPTGPIDLSDADAREWLHWSLAALVTGFDAELGLVFEQLRTRGLDRTAALLITSDFGYPLGEHGQIGRYRPWLYEEIVHLPLLIRLPGEEEACGRIAAYTQPPDIAPTVLDLLGVSLPVELTGVSLMPALRGQGEPGRDCAFSQLEVGGAKEIAIRTDDYALMVPVKMPPGESREPQLYGKPDDHWEVNDLRPRNIEKADELEERLRKMLGGDS